MRYGQIRKFDIANGEGIRTSLFVTGCTHHCPHCFNVEYQDFTSGNLWTKETEEELFSYLKNPNSVGLTVLGGEPMDNARDLLPIVKRFKKEIQKSLWIYSGYTWEEIIKDKDMSSLLKYTDVLVDGPFVHTLKDLTLRFRGSSNQRIIHVPKSLEQGKIELYDLD
ncbi:MAG: anaerobic ribonucleoside-triphosphate reductase activating protein [Tissierellia bacterium]|nr:anaerobic ribonucleoside-triphosphate reductase activating protein [Tissierellia bacterium]